MQDEKYERLLGHQRAKKDQVKNVEGIDAGIDVSNMPKEAKKSSKKKTAMSSSG